MIFDATISHSNGQSIIKTRPSVESVVLGPLIGLFLMAVGCFVLYVFLCGGMSAPTGHFAIRLLGWTVISILFGIFGIVPFVWGLSVAFARRSYRLCEENATVISFLHIAGAPLWTRRYTFSAFERITIQPKEFGVFATHTEFVIACDGKQHLELTAFSEHHTAVAFAESVARQMRLPVQDAG